MNNRYTQLRKVVFLVTTHSHDNPIVTNHFHSNKTDGKDLFRSSIKLVTKYAALKLDNYTGHNHILVEFDNTVVSFVE